MKNFGFETFRKSASKHGQWGRIRRVTDVHRTLMREKLSVRTYTLGIFLEIMIWLLIVLGLSLSNSEPILQ